MIIKETLQVEHQYRYERKFTVRAPHRNEVLRHLRSHPAFFREIYQPRWVNNIYLDTPHRNFYQANVLGVSERKKVRIRWYGATFDRVVNPVLEYKLKHGQIGDKWSWPLAEYTVSNEFRTATLRDLLLRSDLPTLIRSELRGLEPTLLNGYRRTYFRSADGHYRLTLDEQLWYYGIRSARQRFLRPHRTPQQFIIELKYGLDHDDNVPDLSSRFAFRMDKSSKYVNGMDLG